MFFLQLSWVRLKPRCFTLPSVKSRLIEMIQLFYNAPDNYRVKLLLESKLDLVLDEDSFLTATALNGRYLSQLREALEAIVKQAAEAEKFRMF